MKRFLPAAVLVSLLAVLIPVRSSQACGGLFCSAINLIPVQQNAERILFEINDDGTTTTIVEIRYAGSPDAFSWVVPVSDVPELEDGVPAQALTYLDTGTAPLITPPLTQCNGEVSGGLGNRGLAGPAPAMDGAAFGGEESWGAPVDVIDLPQVGAFDPEVVSSEDPDALIEWLNENGYLITPEMEPFVADYVAQGLKFLALKLAPDSAVSDIAPIAMTTPGDPMVPLSLTGVAAEPEMGVMVFIAASERWETSNWENLLIDTDDVQAHPTNGMSNYDPLIAWRIDQTGGKAFVTQYASSTSDVTEGLDQNWSWDPEYEEPGAFLAELAERKPYITRLYARASAWDMTEDPRFESTDGESVANSHDLSDRDPIEVCAVAPDEDDRIPCGDTYCGEGAQCARTAVGQDGCICPAGEVAREITTPRTFTRSIGPTVVCERTDADLMGSLEDLDLDISLGDPCFATDCGENGSCVSVGGFPTCSCEDGYAAITDGAGTLECARVTRTYGAEQLLWASACSGCMTGASSGGGAPLAALLLGLGGMAPLVLRRRRR